MKKIAVIVVALISFASCLKKETKETKEAKENPCPAIDKSLVPQTVKAGFQNKYPSDSVITWFRKDSIGYCAYFLQSSSIKKLAEFDNAGLFLSEETDNHQQENHEDSSDVNNPKGDSGCECEIPE